MMKIVRVLFLIAISQIAAEMIEEEVVQQSNEKIPYHPGISSSSRKGNKKPYQTPHARSDQGFSTQENKHYSSEEKQAKINSYKEQSYPQYAESQGQQRQMRRNPMERNSEHLGGPHKMNNAHMGDPMGMSKHMGGPHRMNDAQMESPMGMHNGYQEHHNMGSYNHHPGPHHVHNGNQPNQNQYTSNINSNSNSWFSGTFGTLYEIMMILFLIGLVYNCIFGRNSNDKHAMNWYNANKQYFEERYEHIGLNKAEMEELPPNTFMKDSVIVKENPYFYKFYCSNYRYIKWSLTALEFKKRFDASAVLTSIFFSDTDKIIFEVAFKPVDPLGWIFCVCKKRDARTIKKSYADLAFFTTNHEPSVMNERMCLMTENLEYFMELFQNKNLFPYYKQIEQFLDVIYFTDQASFCNEHFAVFFSFDINLTYAHQDRRFLEITHFVNLFVDTLAQLKYKQKFKEEVQKNRIDFERSKMEEGQRKEIEEKEKSDFIEKWKIKNKMKYKKGAERKKLEKELAKYS